MLRKGWGKFHFQFSLYIKVEGMFNQMNKETKIKVNLVYLAECHKTTI